MNKLTSFLCTLLCTTTILAGPTLSGSGTQSDDLHEAFGKGEYACTDAASQGKTLPKDFGRKQGAMVCYVVVEHLLQGSSRGGVEDEGVHFVVEAEGTCIEVCGAYGTELTVYHHYLAVMEAVVVVPDFRSALHQLTHLQSDDIVVGHAVALGRYHELHLDAALQCSSERSPDLAEYHGIGVDYLHQMLGVVDGCLVSLPHDAGRLARPAGSKSNGTGARGRESLSPTLS